ncbi:MAG: carotenoid biosynthesis protein [Bacteroidales bacterium]
MLDFIKKHKIIIVKFLIIAGYGISIPGLWMMRDNPQAYQLSWIFTVLSFLLLMLFHKPLNYRFAMSILAVGIVGWLAEAVGTNTGVVFGDYAYGPSLGPKIWGTPFTMVVNWMISVYLIVMVIKSKIINIWRLGFAGASLMVIYDILLEPVAIRLNMWSWGTETPPLQNYIAWFVISFPLVMLLGKFVRNAYNPLALLLFVCQLLFFAALNIMITFWGM